MPENESTGELPAGLLDEHARLMLLRHPELPQDFVCDSCKKTVLSRAFPFTDSLTGKKMVICRNCEKESRRRDV